MTNSLGRAFCLIISTSPRRSHLHPRPDGALAHQGQLRFTDISVLVSRVSLASLPVQYVESTTCIYWLYVKSTVSSGTAAASCDRVSL